MRRPPRARKGLRGKPRAVDQLTGLDWMLQASSEPRKSITPRHYCSDESAGRVRRGPGDLPSFPDLDCETLKHRRVVRLKFTPPLDWRSMLNATLTRPMAPGEWNGNNNNRAFQMVGVPP